MNKPGDAQVASPTTADAKQRLNVAEVLKGICLQPSFAVVGKKLRPGQTAVLLLPYTLGSGGFEGTQPGLWVIQEDGKADTGDLLIHHDVESPIKVGVDMIRSTIAKQTPEQVGLSQQVLNSLLFPEREGELSRHEPITCPVCQDDRRHS